MRQRRRRIRLGSSPQPSILARRIAAYLADIALLFVILVPAGIAIQAVLGPVPVTGPEIAIRIAWNISLPAWIYFFVGDHSVRGATIGKRWLGLNVEGIEKRRLDSGKHC